MRSPTLDSKPSLTAKVAWLIGFFAFLNVYPIQTVLPLIQDEMNISKTATGLLVGITLFAVALLSPFIGFISDRLGRKGIICTSLVGIALPTLLIPLSSHFYDLLLLRFIQGVFLPGIIVVSMAYMAEEVSFTYIAKTTTVYVSGSICGGFFGRIIVGYTAALTDEWRTGFFILALLSAIGITLIIKLAPSSRNFLPSANMRQGLLCLKEHLKNAKLISGCVVGFCSLFSITSGFTYVSYLLHEAPFNLSTSVIANIFAIYLVGELVTSLSGRIIDTLGKQLTVLIATAVSAIGVCLTLIPSFPFVIVGMAGLAIGAFICQATVIAFIATHIKSGRSLATGLYNLSYYGGGAAGTWLSGIANEYYHWPGTVVTILSILAFSAATALRFWGNEQAEDAL